MKFLKNKRRIQAITNYLDTVRDYLRWTLSQFNQASLHYGHGTDSAWDEAVHLVLQALNLPLSIDNRVLDAKLTVQERRKIIYWVWLRINKRLPLPYITNTAWFAKLPFYVDSRVLIPRSPIGELIRNEFEPWCDTHSVHRVLDLCTGGGCIAIGCAHLMPQAQVIGSDISPDALKVAQVNRQKHQMEHQLQLVQSDLFDQLDPEQKFDLIVSNPPYVDQPDMDSLPAEYHHEPRNALAAGQDGLTIVRRILAQASDYLTSQGILIVEVGNSQEALQAEYPEVPFTWLCFEDGGDGVFLLKYDELLAYQDIFQQRRDKAS